MPRVTADGKALVLQVPRETALKVQALCPTIRSAVVEEGLAMEYNHVSYQKMVSKRLLTGWHPISRTYQWPKVVKDNDVFEMYPHCKRNAAMILEHQRCFLLADTRTAKTATMVAAWMWLHYQHYQGTGSCLVVAPMSTITEANVWPEEIAGMAPGMKVGPLLGKNITGAKRRAHVRSELGQRKPWYLINPAGLAIPALFKDIEAAVDSGQIKMIVIDEFTEFASDATLHYKRMEQLAAKVPFFVLASGTQGSPMQVHGPAKLLNPTKIVASKDTWQVMVQVRLDNGKWVDRADAKDKVAEVLTPAIRTKKSDVFQDLPPEMTIPVRVDLDPVTAKVAKDIGKKNGSIIIDGRKFTPTNELVRGMRLLQIVTGIASFSKDDMDAEIKRLPMKAKVEELVRLHRSTEYKTVVYMTFREGMAYLQDELDKYGIKSQIVNSQVNAEARGPIFKSFREVNDFEILIAHPQTAAYGVELATQADAVVFFGPPQVSSFLYQQAAQRVYSKAQKSEAPAVYWLYSIPQELQIFKKLKAGVDHQTAVADLFRDEED